MLARPLAHDATPVACLALVGLRRVAVRPVLAGSAT